MKVLILPGFAAFWIGMWALVAWKTAQAGWATYVPKFAVTEFPRGKKIRAVSGWFTRSHYSSSLVASITAEGLFLRPALFFRAFHPPLRLPWSCITDVSEAGGRWTAATTVMGEVDSLMFKLLLPGAYKNEIEANILNTP